MKTLTTPESSMSPELASLSAQGQALLKSHVDTYTRKDGVTVQAHDDSRTAAQPKAPGIGAHHASLAASSKPGSLDHETNQVAAGYMKSGDHQALKQHLQGSDTAARDHVLDHIHPDHWEGLGYKPLNKDRSVGEYNKTFGGEAKPKVDKPAATKKTDGGNKKFQVRDQSGNVVKVFHGPTAEHEARQHVSKNQGARLSARDVTPSDGSGKPMTKALLFTSRDNAAELEAMAKA
jgi:hypothetical protein